MKLTNQQVKILTLGLQNILMDSDGSQRKLPLLPSVRVKRMVSDLEDLHDAVREVEQEKSEQLEEYAEELDEKVENEEMEQDEAEDLVAEKAESLGDEVTEIHEKEVEVEFSDPLTAEDVDRIDQSENDFPMVSSSAIDIILTEITE